MHASTPSPNTPLAITTREARRLLSLSMTQLYGLLREGKLQSYRNGRARRVTTASIYNYIEQQIAAADGEWRAGGGGRLKSRRAPAST